MVLNMLSTGAMTRLGYVYGNLMVNVHLKNEKLVERGITILQKATGVSRSAAEKMLRTAGGVPAALVMFHAEVGRADAARALRAAKGSVRAAIAAARSL
jgi:N-acetylmuramic acid 6-phosphate etherase